MTSELLIGWDFEASGRCLIETLSRHLPGGTGETHEKSARLADSPGEIRTEDLPNVSLRCHRYDNYFERIGNSKIV
jgi:hypothetical protein